MSPSRYVTPLSELLSLFNVTLPKCDPQIMDITLDSRKVAAGSLFIAVPGYAVDGRDFISAAINAGAAAVFAEANRSTALFCEYRSNIPVVNIPELGKRVSELAGLFFKHPSKQLKVIAVTGTNGKTTCAHLLLQLFQLLGERAATIGTIGYGTDLSSLSSTGLTTPDAIECQRILASFAVQKVRFVSMEVSSHAIAQSRVRGVQFESAIFTNLTRDHLDFHGSMEAYAAEKLRLFKEWDLMSAVVNLDDKYSETFLQTVLSKGVPVTGYGQYSSHHSVANIDTVLADAAVFSMDGLSCLLRVSQQQLPLDAPLLGRFNLYNLLAVIAAVRHMKYPLTTIVQTIRKIRPTSGRMHLVESNAANSDISVCVDYAHTPDALEQALLAAREHTKNQLWVVFGCGGDRDPGKRPLMGEIAVRLADRVVVTSDNPRTEEPGRIIADILTGGGNDSTVTAEENREQAINLAVMGAAPGDLILLAGKGHEDYQILGTEKIPFSDFVVAQKAVQRRLERAGGVQ